MRLPSKTVLLLGLALIQACQSPPPAACEGQDYCVEEDPIAGGDEEGGKGDGKATATKPGASPATEPGAAGPAGPLPAVIPAPVTLRAYVGGPSVALRWNERGNPTGVVEHKIFRDGAVVGTVKLGFHADFVEKYGNGFIDPGVQPGKTYRYEVQAVDTSGKTSAKSAPLSVTTPATALPVPRITLDASKATDQTEYLEKMVKPFLEVWYPKLSEILARPAFTPAAAFTVRIDPAYDGVAYASGPLIVMSAAFARDACPKNYDRCLGAFLHEAVHVVQFGTTIPGWMVEGMADWAREYVMHDRDPVPIRPRQVYTAGYSEGSFFLNWMQEKYDPQLIRQINIRYRNGTTYTDAALQQLTGKSLAALWDELRRENQLGPKALKVGDQCLDGSPETRAATAATCAPGANQSWTVVRGAYDTIQLVVGPDSCLDVQYSGTTPGTKVWTWPCNGGAAETWRVREDKKLENPHSGLCLAPGAGGLVLERCDDPKTPAVTGI